MIAVRRAKLSDVDALVEVHVETWKVAYRGQLPDEFLDRQDETRPRRTAMWHATLADSALRIFVAELDGAVVGFVTVGRSRDDDRAPDTGELHGIYVHPRAWDTGTGRALMERAVEELRALGYREATLWVLGSNERARRFYETAGWHADGATKVEHRGDLELREARYRRAL